MHISPSKLHFRTNSIWPAKFNFANNLIWTVMYINRVGARKTKKKIEPGTEFWPEENDSDIGLIRKPQPYI